MSTSENSPPRRLRLFLRDHRVLDASARVPDGQFLTTYLSSRKRYVTLHDVDWLGTRATIPHMVLKVDKVLWASSQDGELPLTHPHAAVAPRRVEVELDGGYLLRAGLLVVADQRLSDYLQGAPVFVPLRHAELRPRDRALGDIVVNHDAIQLVRELDEAGDPDAPRPEQEIPVSG